MLANPIFGQLEGVSPVNQDFLGPEMAASEASASWDQKNKHSRDNNKSFGLFLGLLLSVPFDVGECKYCQVVTIYALHPYIGNFVLL